MTVQHSAEIEAHLRSIGMPADEYIRRHRRARRSMLEIERKLFDLVFVDDKSVEQAGRELGIEPDVAMQYTIKAAQLHCRAILAPRRPWWRKW